MKTSFLKKAADPFERLFWRAQIGVLRACPPLSGVVARVSLSAANSRAVWLKTLLQVAAQAPGAVARHWRNRRENRVALPRVTVFVTTRCTLRCDKCAAHIPDRQERRDIPTEDLTGDIRALLGSVDYIYVVCLTGGEPFLHPDLGEFIRVCADSGKVGGISIVTNGTVFPGAKTLAALQEADAIVKISRYASRLQPHAEELKDALKANGIRYTHESGTSWCDLGGAGQLEAGPPERRFSVCTDRLCMPLYKGRLHICAESALWAEEGLVPDCVEDSADVHAGPVAFREQLRALLKKRVLAACPYCRGNTYRTPRVPVAAQRGSERKDTSLREN